MQEQEIRQLVQDMITQNGSSSQFNLTPTNFHQHNGFDSMKIQAKNLVYNDKVFTGIVAENETTQFTLNLGIVNPTSIKLNGIARNNLSGAAIKKTTINGFAELGACYFQTDFNSQQQEPVDVQQMNGGTLFDNTSGAWVPSVFTSGGTYIAMADPSNPTTTAYLKVLSYTNSSITFLAFAADDWRLTVNLIIT